MRLRGLVFGLFALGCAVAHAQNAANVSVNATQVRAVMPATGQGLNTEVWDWYMTADPMAKMLRATGVTMLRYPGGSYADIYHWQTHTATAGTGAYIAPDTDFDQFMTLVQAAGATPIITVNYGSNPDGTGPGTTAEAASWVLYANRLHPWNVKYGEVGNELYGNGFYYNVNWEEDLHAPEEGDRSFLPALGPTAYGQNSLAFVRALKMADPTVKVGVVLTAPGFWPDGIDPDWNSHVLAACGSAIDFVIVHFYPDGSNLADLLAAPSVHIPSMVSTLRSLISTYCGPRAASVGIFVTEGDAIPWNAREPSALFAADSFATWMENGVNNFDWWDEHNGIDPLGDGNYDDQGMFSNGTSGGGLQEPPVNTPFPPYWGYRLANLMASPGDSYVTATSDRALLLVHSAVRKDGSLGLMLVNEDPGNATTATVHLSGFTPGLGAIRWDYGPGSTGLRSSIFLAGGTTFTVKVPAYTASVLTIPHG